jgi:hypothetical protein
MCVGVMTGSSNVIMGADSAKNATSLASCVIIGASAVQTGVATGANNVYIGANAAKANTSGDGNVAIGKDAFISNTTGASNIAIGIDALDGCDAENNNIAIGQDVLGGSVAGGEFNTAVGNYSLDALTSGDYNVAVGYNSGGVVTTGGTNTLIGVEAGYQLTEGSNNTLVGLEAGRTQSPATITTGSNNIVLGNNSVANAYIKVDWTVTSDKRDKTDVKEFNMGLDFVNALNPVTYRWDMRSDYPNSTPDGTHKKPKLFSGLIAQDVEILEREYGYKVEDDTAVITSVTEDGNYGLNYSKFVPVLINAVKELSTKVKALEEA